MIAGIDTRTGVVRVWRDTEAEAARAWCYLCRSRALYEIDGRLVLYASRAVARQRVLARGRLLTTGRNAPHRHTSAELRRERDAARRRLRAGRAA